MELKLLLRYLHIGVYFLLIVPYGIETNKLSDAARDYYELLIVPYGIETVMALYRSGNIDLF